MHLLYLDESGNDPSLPFFVLAGVSVSERQTHWIEQDMNAIAKRFTNDALTDIELHGSPMHTGNKRWRKVEPELRTQAIKDALEIGIAQRWKYGVRLFGAVIKRDILTHGQNAIDVAFEQVCARFDMMLTRLNRKQSAKNNPPYPERGLILFDKAANELTIQAIAKEFKYEGHQWGRTKNYAEVPVFLDSESSRLIQLADLVAYALYQNFAHKNDSYFKIIANQFDSVGNQTSGLFILNS